MRVSGGLTDQGIVIGNVYDKYGSRNPLVRWIMRGFDDALAELIAKATPRTIHEIGCGEGFWVLTWNHQGIHARGSDFSEKVIELARANAETKGLAPGMFQVRSIYDIDPVLDGADLMVCCEVLEHLEHPEDGLRALQRVASKHVILSVPREPIWRLLNVARGKYLAELGNTPGHLQHWSQAEFLRLVERYFEVVQVRTPLPWTMVLCRGKG